MVALQLGMIEKRQLEVLQLHHEFIQLVGRLLFGCSWDQLLGMHGFKVGVWNHSFHLVMDALLGSLFEYIEILDWIRSISWVFWVDAALVGLNSLSH